MKPRRRRYFASGGLHPICRCGGLQVPPCTPQRESSMRILRGQRKLAAVPSMHYRSLGTRIPGTRTSGTNKHRVRKLGFREPNTSCLSTQAGRGNTGRFQSRASAVDHGVRTFRLDRRALAFAGRLPWLAFLWLRWGLAILQFLDLRISNNDFRRCSSRQCRVTP